MILKKMFILNWTSQKRPEKYDLKDVLKKIIFSKTSRKRLEDTLTKAKCKMQLRRLQDVLFTSYVGKDVIFRSSCLKGTENNTYKFSDYLEVLPPSFKRILKLGVLT